MARDVFLESLVSDGGIVAAGVVVAQGVDSDRSIEGARSRARQSEVSERTVAQIDRPGLASAPVPNAVLVWAKAVPALRRVMSKYAATGKLNLAGLFRILILCSLFSLIQILLLRLSLTRSCMQT